MLRDEHCHILYGVDDGAATRQDSLAMLDAAAAAGICEVVATPHLRWDDFDASLVEERFADISREAQRRGINMTLGFEVYYKTLVRLGLDRAPEFAFAGTNRILVEFNTGGSMAQGWDRTFYQLQAAHGLDVVLAHPERYTTVLDDFDVVYRLRDMGVLLQVSAMDLYRRAPLLSRSPLRGMAACARRIVKEGLCDALVSDAHCPEHYQAFSRAAKHYGALCGVAS